MSRYITVSIHTEAINAHILRNRLVVEGIPAHIAHEHHVAMDWLIAQALGGIKVQVPEEYAEQAAQIVADAEDGKFALDDADDDALSCPNCGNQELSYHSTKRKIALFGLVVLSLPLPFRKGQYHCRLCGHEISL